jgi:hypothetical protein
MHAVAMLAMILALSDTPHPRSLDAVLAGAAESVERFWQQFASVNCTEQVSQARLDPKGKPVYQHESSFDYLIFLSRSGDDLSVEESRVLQKEAGRKQNLPLLVTSGFPTLQLIFHRFYQGSFEYELLGDEIVEGKTLMRVRFRHVPGTRSTSALRLRGRDFPLDVQGEAWIDPEDGAITRVKAGLAGPLEDLGLTSLKSDVRYGPVRFPPGGDAYWLPLVATVEVETPRQHWRNVHRFADYKRFSIESETKVKP